MKRHLIINTLVFVLFIILDPIFNWCCDLADMYSLGAEMVLGIMLPLLFSVFILFTICSIGFSLYRLAVTKDIKNIVPIIVIVVLVTFYLIGANQDSLWVRIFEYYR